MYALDTNTLIYFFKGAGRIKDKLFSVPPSEIALPSVALFELEFGVAESRQPDKRRAQLDELLKVVAVLSFDAKAAGHSAEVAATLRRKGEAIGALDTLIAGTALAHGATLVTHNVAEFGRVPGLRIEDWF